MKYLLKIVILIILVITASISADDYSWSSNYDSNLSIENIIEPPESFVRVTLGKNSFGHWLRNLPLKKDNQTVFLYNGERKLNQDAHVEIIDIDIGKKDLQQCADAVIRLKAEFHFSRLEFDSISFNFTSGDKASFRKWIEGFRPKVNGNKVNWNKTQDIDSSYANLKSYLETVFTYSGSYSLSKELRGKNSTCDIEPGDVFIVGGFPGHAIIVIDVAVNLSNNKKVFMLAQGFTPAQDIHILKNKTDSNLTPWFDCDFGKFLFTPEWTFEKNQLMSF